MVGNRAKIPCPDKGRKSAWSVWAEAAGKGEGKGKGKGKGKGPCISLPNNGSEV